MADWSASCHPAPSGCRSQCKSAPFEPIHDIVHMERISVFSMIVSQTGGVIPQKSAPRHPKQGFLNKNSPPRVSQVSQGWGIPQTRPAFDGGGDLRTLERAHQVLTQGRELTESPIGQLIGQPKTHQRIFCYSCHGIRRFLSEIRIYPKVRLALKNNPVVYFKAR